MPAAPQPYHLRRSSRETVRARKHSDLEATQGHLLRVLVAACASWSSPSAGPFSSEPEPIMLPTASLQIPPEPMLCRLIDAFCPFSLFFLVAFLLTASGCSPRDAGAEAGNGPEVLRLAYLPSEEDPEGRQEALG